MYEQIGKIRKTRIHTQGKIDLQFPMYHPNIYASGYPETATIDYVKFDGKPMDYLSLFMCEVSNTVGMLLIHDLEFRGESARYPLGVLEELCDMTIDAIEWYCIERKIECLMVMTKISLFPEIFIKRGYELDRDTIFHRYKGIIDFNQ